MASTTDRIEKKVLLNAPLERVWSAISDAKQFGTWFGMKFDGPFTPSARLTGMIVPTRMDSEVAKMQEPHAGKPFEIRVDRVEPKRLFSFYWHPYAIEPGADSCKEPMTLVAFELEPAPDGTMLTITESGFDQVPVARRAEAFKANEVGWNEQAKLIAKYLAQAG